MSTAGMLGKLRQAMDGQALEARVDQRIKDCYSTWRAWMGPGAHHHGDPAGDVRVLARRCFSELQ